MPTPTVWQWTDLIQPVLTGLITASAALGGVYLGGWLTERRDARKEAARIDVERSYLACLVIAHLDRLAGQSANVAYDDGTSEGRPAGENGCLEETVSVPTFAPLELDVDWKVLPKEFMFAVLELPRQLSDIETALLSPDLNDPPYDDYFYQRQRRFARFALKVERLSRELRSMVDMPFEHIAKGGWNREEAMTALVHRLETAEAKRRERQAKRLAEMNLSDGATANTP